MILLDTNVFVYALGGPHPLREPAARLFTAARDRTAVLTSIEVVYVELLYVLARRRDRAQAVRGVASYFELLGQPLPTTEHDRVRALELYARHARLESVDALVAATGLRDDVDLLVTADRSFSDVPGLSIVDLGSLELESVIP